ncbi:MAG: hypothetical protein ABSE58_05240 [Candidatus Limnocylindrales bacterium]|jgi:hypothetical protein
MSAVEPPVAADSSDLARVAARRMLIFSPTIRFALGPGDRALVAAGDTVVPGMPIVERTPEPELVDAGRVGPDETSRPARLEPGAKSTADEELAPLWKERSDVTEWGPTTRGPMAIKPEAIPTAPKRERRRPPEPGKWWVGGNDRRGKPEKGKPSVRVGGTLLFETHGHWRAAAGERHEIVGSPVAGVIRAARHCVEVTIEVAGAALPAAIAAGEPSRGYLDLPRLTDGNLWPSALDVGRAGAVVVAGSRISAQAISRARAMSIRGLIAGSVGQGELRDLAASEQRQKASLAPSAPFGLIALDGHGRRPIATPVLALLAALAGRPVAIVTDPPLLVFDAAEVALPEIPPEWVRARSGAHAGREGRWIGPAGLYRFRGGIHLEAAIVRFAEETETTVVPVADLERFIF